MDEQLLQILNVIGTWLAGIGTVGAVIVSLSLARKSNSIKLKFKLIPSREKIKISVINTGHVEFAIKSIYLKHGIFKKRYIYLESNTDEDLLKYGHETDIFARYRGPYYYEQWFKELVNGIFKGGLKRLKLRFLKVRLITTFDDILDIKIRSKTFKEVLLKAFNDKLIIERPVTEKED